ncbi:MAG: redox-regulated ATPase YchF [Candidatus Omnitrophica bacterium]|nr:redox-regulated ATPase YchF [Candidatus Omnitrophota bacterium]
MQIGLIGLPQAGKKTLMRLLTGVDASVASSGNGAAVPGVCPVRDPRIGRLVALYRPAKVTPATIQYWLMPDVTKDSAKNQELLKALLTVDALACVVRAFSDETVFHLDGSVDPLRDVTAVQAELILNDLLFVEKRLERIAKELKTRGGADRAQEQALLGKLQAHLNDDRPLRTLALDEQEQRVLSGTPLLTRKPCVIVLNVDESAIRDRRLSEAVAARCAEQQVHIVQLSAKIEAELAQLEDPAERAAFMEAIGIAEPAIAGLTRVSYEALGLLSYFTVGTDEVRAWTVRRGACAPEAGGAIHSDIQRGFIRAELMKYDDLIALGSEQAVASAGKASLKGKDYVVEDGDILNFRFNP